MSNNLTHPSLMSISCCFLLLFSIKEVGSNLGTLAPVENTNKMNTCTLPPMKISNDFLPEGDGVLILEWVLPPLAVW